MAPVKCEDCDEKIARNDRYIRCALCEHYYHQQCTDDSDDLYDMFSAAQRVGFRWMCTECLVGFESKKVIRSISEQLDQLAKQVPAANISQNQSTVKKFSDIVKQAIESKGQSEGTENPRVNEALIVKPTPEAKSTLVKDLDTALRSVKVHSLRKRQDGSVVLSFPCKESKNVALTKLQSSIQAEIAQPKKLQPKMTIVGVPKHVPDDAVVKSIREKNAEIDALMKKGHEMSVCFTRPRNEDKLVVVKLSPNIRSVINENRGFLYIGFSRCKVYDRFYVTQCYHCQKFNHIAANCSSKNEAPVCGRCSGRHTTKNCNNDLKCSNCVANKLSATDHNSSSSECPILLRMRNRIVSNTDYEPKNE